MPVSDIEIEKKLLAKEYKELLNISYQSLNKEDKKLIRKADIEKPSSQMPQN